ncbi:MAG TPA: hypothetical protein VGW38_17450 [Chloroflexota bacterium]|nr:hypothetical protein [Chloroflexota bacterium]
MTLIEALRASGPRVPSGLLRRQPEDSYPVETLVSAIATVLVTRLYLEWTGYPQIGNDTLHIAHMLWGGLLMLVAGRLGLAFSGAGIRRLSAVLLGIGFGLFIDEIGKFVTRDHDYFFRPAAALIYVSFVLLYLMARATQRLAPVEPGEDRTALLSALETLEEAARGMLQPDQKAAALRALDQVATSGGPHREFAQQLRALIEQQEPVPLRAPGWMARQVAVARQVASVRDHIVDSSRHRTWLLRLIVAATLFGLLEVAGSMLVVTLMSVNALTGVWTPGPDFTVVALQATGSVVAGAFFLRGLWALRGNTATALRLIGTGFTITILVVNVFTFYFHQFGATTGALTSLVLLQGVRSLRSTSS